MHFRLGGAMLAFVTPHCFLKNAKMVCNVRFEEEEEEPEERSRSRTQKWEQNLT